MNTFTFSTLSLNISLSENQQEEIRRIFSRFGEIELIEIHEENTIIVFEDSLARYHANIFWNVCIFHRDDWIVDGINLLRSANNQPEPQILGTRSENNSSGLHTILNRIEGSSDSKITLDEIQRRQGGSHESVNPDIIEEEDQARQNNATEINSEVIGSNIGPNLSGNISQGQNTQIINNFTNNTFNITINKIKITMDEEVKKKCSLPVQKIIDFLNSCGFSDQSLKDIVLLKCNKNFNKTTLFLLQQINNANIENVPDLLKNHETLTLYYAGRKKFILKWEGGKNFKLDII